ncbi:MAG: phospho-N-acetylmuramoyl-pentapeptide-transferase [Bacteroidales bacterium]
MLYYLFEYLETFNIPGIRVFQYISFRAGLTFIFSLAFTILFGKYVIRFLQKQQIGEIIRDLGLEGQMQKKGTPTMGGILIISAILIPVLLFSQLHNIYIILMIFTTLWLGMIGFADDYIKVFKKNKEGLKGIYKMAGQIVLGLIVGLTLHYNSNVVIIENVVSRKTVVPMELAEENDLKALNIQEVKSTKTTIPFIKNNEFDYSWFLWFMGSEASKKWSWIVFIFFVVLITTAVSNGANMTDGLDGLATGISAIIGAALAVFAYLSGHVVYADYLNIMYIPHSGELVVFAAGFLGATIGFLWYNA